MLNYMAKINLRLQMKVRLLINCIFKKIITNYLSRSTVVIEVLKTPKMKSEKGPESRKELKILCCWLLKMQKGARSQGMLVTSGILKR